MYRVWHSAENFANYIIKNTILESFSPEKKRLVESDANNPKDFHKMPDHIKKILYLDAPDIIIEKDNEPILSIEISSEAGTGHNVFQRFARLVAAVENNVPAFYIYPEAAIIKRTGGSLTWDRINPLVFKALDRMMTIYRIPALLFYYPSHYRSHTNPADSPNRKSKGLKRDRIFISCPDSRDKQMKNLFSCINETLMVLKKKGTSDGKEVLLANLTIDKQKDFMAKEYLKKNVNKKHSPLSATQKKKTEYILNHLKKYESASYKIGELLRKRKETVFYQINAKFRGDPYPGALSAVDFLFCREGKTFEDRKHNLVLVWGKLSFNEKTKSLKLKNEKGSTINDFMNCVKNSESKNLLVKNYSQLKNHQISRYYMQVRYGSTYSKRKEIRIYSYFADAILFPDGALWRDA